MTMFARRRSHVYLREESFGIAVYAADRDDIFLLDKRSGELLKSFSNRWKGVLPSNQPIIKKFGSLGLLDVKATQEAALLPQSSYSGVHLLGDFVDVPLVDRPLLTNCFSTAWCPLKCVYCHADDLMGQDLRSAETTDGIDGVVRMASRLDSLVNVITGGDPLTKPERALRLAEKIRDNAGVVIDTSGAGRIEDAIRLLKVRPMHLRVSIDSMDPRINKKTRPVNAKVVDINVDGATSLEMASRLIGEAGCYASGVSVQTVISSKNDKAEHLFQFRDWLISRGVKNWVLHLTINAGAARRFALRTPLSGKNAKSDVSRPPIPARKNTTILPDRAEASRAVRQLIEATTRSGLDIDIRCTDANTAPNSVFLVGSEGSLYTQGRGPDGGRKVKLLNRAEDLKDNSLWTYVSCLDHVQRYINYVPMIHGPAPKGLALWDEKV